MTTALDESVSEPRWAVYVRLRGRRPLTVVTRYPEDIRGMRVLAVVRLPEVSVRPAVWPTIGQKVVPNEPP